MTIITLLKERGLSRYSLAKKSGVPWAMLSDICFGKTRLSRRNAQTVLKRSKALDLLSIEEVLKINAEVGGVTEPGKPKDKSYLERNISPQLTKEICNYTQGEKREVSYMGCLWDEFYDSINLNLWPNCITEEQAQYLRTKHLYGEEYSDD